VTATSKKRADHYLPAALIGGFGRPNPRPGKTKLRFATVAVREHTHSNKVKCKRAENVAKKIGEYWVAHPPPGYSPNFIDGYWDEYEPELPAAVRRLGDRTWTERDWETVRKHVVAESVRNPDFERAATEFRAAKGDPITHRDEVQYERLVTLANTPALLASSRFAVVRTPEDGRRFITNDKGYTTVADPYVNQKGVLFPLSGTVAVLCVPEVGEIPGQTDAWLSVDLTLTPGGVEGWNLASWQQKDSLLVVGHPDDEEWIAGLDERPLVFPALGPYRNRGVEGAFEWAYADGATNALMAPGGPGLPDR
jgi:hypothetical protein